MKVDESRSTTVSGNYLSFFGTESLNMLSKPLYQRIFFPSSPATFSCLLVRLWVFLLQTGKNVSHFLDVTAWMDGQSYFESFHQCFEGLFPFLLGQQS